MTINVDVLSDLIRIRTGLTVGMNFIVMTLRTENHVDYNSPDNA